MTSRALLAPVLSLLACTAARVAPPVHPTSPATDYASFARAFPAIARGPSAPACAPEQRLSAGHCCDPGEAWTCAWGRCACRADEPDGPGEVAVPEALEIARPCMRAASTLDEASCCVVAAMQIRRTARESHFVRMAYREGGALDGPTRAVEACRRRFPNLPW